VASENREVAARQKNLLTELFQNKNRPDIHTAGVYYLVPSDFVHNWRRFV